MAQCDSQTTSVKGDTINKLCIQGKAFTSLISTFTVFNLPYFLSSYMSLIPHSLQNCINHSFIIKRNS